MKSKAFGPLLLSLALLGGLSGCVIWDAGYTENKPVSRYVVPPADKFPITYSVSMSAERDDVFALPEVKGLRKKIEDALLATGMFSEVSYGAKGGQDSYHIDFSFRQSGVREDQSMAVAFLSGYTLLLFPTGEVLTFDGSAVLSLQGKPLYSTAKAEEIRCLNWLPLAPIGLFMNSWTVWNALETGSVNALCEEISHEHKRRYLKDSDIFEIVPE